jgi:hypothetical protein
MGNLGLFDWTNNAEGVESLTPIWQFAYSTTQPPYHPIFRINPALSARPTCCATRDTSRFENRGAFTGGRRVGLLQVVSDTFHQA